MKSNELDAVRQLERQEREQLAAHPPLPRTMERPTVHWTELTPAAPGSRIATEWNFYLTQVGRLLAEGHEGKWVLIKGEECIGIFASEQEAIQVAAQRFPMQDVLIHQVLERETILRGPSFFRLWLS